MRSLVYWGMKLCLLGTTLITSTLIDIAPLLALSESEVVKKLNNTPCFLITNSNGLPLTRHVSDKDGKSGLSYTQVFMSIREAQSFISQLQQQRKQAPKMAAMIKELRITTVGLGDIHKKSRESAKHPNSLKFAFQPGQEEIKGALSLLKQQGRKIDKFVSVPLFMISAEGKGYVSIKRGPNQDEIIPLYFSKKDAQNLLQQVKKKYPKAKLEVGDIDGVLNVLYKRNDSWLSQVFLVPSSDSLQFFSQMEKIKDSNDKLPKPKG